jgi:hypothetical protein
VSIGSKIIKVYTQSMDRVIVQLIDRWMD